MFHFCCLVLDLELDNDCVFVWLAKKMNNKPLNLNLLAKAGDGEESYSKYLSQLKLN